MASALPLLLARREVPGTVITMSHSVNWVRCGLGSSTCGYNCVTWNRLQKLNSYKRVAV
jgi:hypothetical protein